MAQEPIAGIAKALEQLETTLEAALEISHELNNDQQLRRIIAAFHHMPREDRPVILGVLEREVTGRLLSRATEKPVGQSTHPNPNARLYVRAHSSGYDRRLYDRDQMMIADIRALRIACLIRNVPDIYTIWKDAMREAMEHVDEETRMIAEGLLHDILACIAQARAAASPTPAPVAPPAPAKKGPRRRSS